MIRKVSIVLMTMIMTLSLTSAVFADQTTTLTTTVPGATYTLNIPADMTVEYGKTNTNIGTVTVSNSSGFATGKDLEVTITYDGLFKSKTVATTIPYELRQETTDGSYHPVHPLSSGSKMTFLGMSDTKCSEKTFYYTESTNYSMSNIALLINSTNWGKALGGTYTTTLTFSSEVVAESN